MPRCEKSFARLVMLPKRCTAVVEHKSRTLFVGNIETTVHSKQEKLRVRGCVFPSASTGALSARSFWRAIRSCSTSARRAGCSPAPFARGSCCRRTVSGTSRRCARTAGGAARAAGRQSSSASSPGTKRRGAARAGLCLAPRAGPSASPTSSQGTRCVRKLYN